MNIYLNFKISLTLTNIKYFFLNLERKVQLVFYCNISCMIFLKYFGMEHCPLATQKRDLEVPCGTVGRALANRGRTKT
jgi:hypothetical protein